MFNEGPRLIEPRFCQGRGWIFRLANPLRSPTLTSFDTIRSSGTICARSNPRASSAYTWNEVIKILRGPLIILLIMVSIIPRRVVENHWSDSTLFCFRLSFYSLTHSLSLSLSLSVRHKTVSRKWVLFHSRQRCHSMSSCFFPRAILSVCLRRELRMKLSTGKIDSDAFCKGDF